MMYASYFDYGRHRQLQAESLRALAELLVEAGYDGPHLAAIDEAGFLRGWVGTCETSLADADTNEPIIAPWWRAR